mmetsp:Transcript_35030/g.60317  ORF Transcript_35030/g.60317 Transcript_35030/m.60317 type:complete len:155 (+) Transcript_35030:1899-2363(+)
MMPPWAQKELHCLGSATAVSIVTDRPNSAAFSAVEQPATPLPITSRSASPIFDSRVEGGVVAGVVPPLLPSVVASGVLLVENPDPFSTKSMAPLTPKVAVGGVFLLLTDAAGAAGGSGAPRPTSGAIGSLSVVVAIKAGVGLLHYFDVWSVAQL